MVKKISDNEIYLLIKYIKSVFWRVAKRLSYKEDAWCLKVNLSDSLGVGGQRHATAALAQQMTQYPLYRRTDGLQGWSGRTREMSSPPVVEPRTVQTVASRCPDCATPPPKKNDWNKILKMILV